MSAMPDRIQRKRTKGWKMPENAVYVGRPTVWGNPWRPEDCYSGVSKPERHAWAVRRYEQDARDRQFIHYDLCDEEIVGLSKIPALLGGKDLVCWCPLTAPCHADYLLELANPEAGASRG